MLVDECNMDHSYSMLNIRKWCQPYQSANRVNLVGYCDYCCIVKTANNCTKAQGLQHLNECRGTFYEPSAILNTYQDHTFQPFNFQKDKTGKWVYKCTLCNAKIYNKHYLPNHLCYTPIPELKAPIANDKLFVFDLEAYQKLVQKQVNSELHVHEA